MTKNTDPKRRRISDLIVAAGCALAAIGAGLIYLPAGLIAGGILAVAYGLVILEVGA